MEKPRYYRGMSPTVAEHVAEHMEKCLLARAAEVVTLSCQIERLEAALARASGHNIVR